MGNINNHVKCKEFNIFKIKFKDDCYTVFAVFNEFCMFLTKIHQITSGKCLSSLPVYFQPNMNPRADKANL